MVCSESGDDRERRLNEAAAHYFELQADGKQVDRQRWLSQYPDLAKELDSFLSNLDFLKQARRIEQQDTRRPAREGLDNTPQAAQLASTDLANTLQAVPAAVGLFLPHRQPRGVVHQRLRPCLPRRVKPDASGS